MNEAKLRELINKEIDGIISKEEKYQLHEYLKKNPEKEIIYQEIIKTSELREQIKDIDPSPNFKNNILKKIDPDRYASDPSDNIERVSIFDWFSNINPRTGYAFAAGLMIGIIFYSVFLTDMIRENKLDNINYYGTIGIPETADTQKLDQVPLDLPGVKGTINFIKFDKILWFDIKILTSDRCEMAFRFDQTQTSFTSFKPLDHLFTTVENKNDKLIITTNENSHFLLFFTLQSSENTQIDLHIASTSEEPFTYKFQLRSEDRK